MPGEEALHGGGLPAPGLAEDHHVRVVERAIGVEGERVVVVERAGGPGRAHEDAAGSEPGVGLEGIERAALRRRHLLPAEAQKAGLSCRRSLVAEQGALFVTTIDEAGVPAPTALIVPVPG